MTKPTKKKEGKKERKSPCCGAEMDYDSGGYDGEDIVPIREFCKKCGQTISVNGMKNPNIIKQ